MIKGGSGGSQWRRPLITLKNPREVLEEFSLVGIDLLRRCRVIDGYELDVLRIRVLGGAWLCWKNGPSVGKWIKRQAAK